MARNDPFVVSGTADNGNSVTIEGSTGGTGAAEIVEIGGGDSATVYREIDTNNDGTFDQSVQVDSLSGESHSQLNELIISAVKNTRLRIENTSGNAGVFYYAVGIEVDEA